MWLANLNCVKIEKIYKERDLNCIFETFKKKNQINV